MEESKITDLLMELSQKISALQKDVEYLKSEMHTNYVRSDEHDEQMRDLIEERTKSSYSRQDTIKQELQTQIQLLKSENDLQNKTIEKQDLRVTALENAKAKKALGWVEYIEKYIFVGFVGLIAYLLLQHFGITMPQ